MKTLAYKTPENKNQLVYASSSRIQNSSKSTFQFVDNRPEADSQGKLQEMANNNPQVKQASQFQAMANSRAVPILQKQSKSEEEELQKKAAPNQKKNGDISPQSEAPVSEPVLKNNTGLPDNLKSGIENLSGYAMDDVKVHYNSQKPATLQAHAYAQGTEIHIASGQEKHLPHEAWHVVQQKQGRVKPSIQLQNKVNVNDDAGLEKEADVMGGKALQFAPNCIEEKKPLLDEFVSIPVEVSNLKVIQRNGKGKVVVNDLTNPSWVPPGKSETKAGKAAITGAELKILLRGAAVAAWDTYSYHATKSENTESIVTKGLDPNRGGTGAASGNSEFEKHSKGQVHYTRNRGLAEDYQRHFQGDSPFGRKDPNPGQAEVLKIAVPRDVVDKEEVDPDSRTSDRAYRTTKHIPGKYIRKTNPVPIPEPKARKRGKQKAEPLISGANAEVWKDHVIRSFAETDALLSNMPTPAINVLYDVMKRGLDVITVLQLVKQALQSMPASDILEFKPENYKANPRVMQGEHIDATGDILPMKY